VVAGTNRAFGVIERAASICRTKNDGLNGTTMAGCLFGFFFNFVVRSKKAYTCFSGGERAMDSVDEREGFGRCLS
jgi:hypothetical protein